MSTVQDRIEENVAAALHRARHENGVAQANPEGASVWALIAIAEALDGIRQQLVRGTLAVSQP